MSDVTAGMTSADHPLDCEQCKNLQRVVRHGCTNDYCYHAGTAETSDLLCADCSEGAAPRAEGLDPEEVARIVHDIWPVPGCTATVHDHNWGPDSFYGSFAERLVARLSRPSDERIPESEEPR